MKRGSLRRVGQLASVLYAGPTNLDRDVKLQLAQPMPTRLSLRQLWRSLAEYAPAQPGPGLAEPNSGSRCHPLRRKRELAASERTRTCGRVPARTGLHRSISLVAV